MPVLTTYPGVYIEEISSGVHTITGVATSITAFVGYTQRGLDNRATHSVHRRFDWIPRIARCRSNDRESAGRSGEHHWLPAPQRNRSNA